MECSRGSIESFPGQQECIIPFLRDERIRAEEASHEARRTTNASKSLVMSSVTSHPCFEESAVAA
eukprot:scaffold387_cov244-Pinguiococcus_pyrenoidosus.AAC.11